MGSSKPAGVNLVGCLIDASQSRRRHSDLSMTTTLEPLSGLVITMSSHFLSLLIDFSLVLGGLDPFLST